MSDSQQQQQQQQQQEQQQETMVEERQVQESTEQVNNPTLENGGEMTDTEVPVDPEMVERLSQGFLTTLLPDAERVKSTMDGLTENQRILIETVLQENAKFNECKSFHELTETMAKAKIYHAKLISIKREMAMLNDKSGKLKKRAVKIQQQKQKEALQREQQRDREMERERQLMAKPAKRSSSTEDSSSPL